MSREKSGLRRIALFGGSFDPVHAGHLAVAIAAQRRFHFHRLFFIPAGSPPHKASIELSPYGHRFAMIALACARHSSFAPSLAEAGADQLGRRIFYSVDTVRHFRREFDRSSDRLYFLLGADSFLQLPSWRNYETLLESCDFIVASRPGFRTDVLRGVIPAKLLAPETKKPARRPSRSGAAGIDGPAVILRSTSVYLLNTVSSQVSATRVRRDIRHGRSIRRLVPALVEEYITKQALYR